MSEEEERKYESNNIKIAMTAILSILLGTAFILALVHFGMNVQQNIDAKVEEKEEKEKVVSILNVDYSSAEFRYVAPTGGLTTKEEADAQPKNYLISEIKDDYDENYLVIDNQDLLDKAISKLRSAASDESISYDVEDKFFTSGSVILVTSEKSGLGGLDIKSVSRDEDYNIQIDAVEKNVEKSSVQDASEGRAVFIKIRNIQPKSVKVNIENEAKDKQAK